MGLCRNSQRLRTDPATALTEDTEVTEAESLPCLNSPTHSQALGSTHSGSQAAPQLTYPTQAPVHTHSHIFAAVKAGMPGGITLRLWGQGYWEGADLVGTAAHGCEGAAQSLAQQPQTGGQECSEPSCLQHLRGRQLYVLRIGKAGGRRGNRIYG
eukprot:1156532-Pelagomonas_calceolata.AAC.3